MKRCEVTADRDERRAVATCPLCGETGTHFESVNPTLTSDGSAKRARCATMTNARQIGARNTITASALRTHV